MSVYIPNAGQKEALKSILMQQALILGLYKNQIIPDGSTIFAVLEELPTGGGRGYAPKAINNVLKEGAAAADLWAISINASGKAQAQYSNVPQEWTFQNADVADGNTFYGVFGYVLVVPFTTGSAAIKVGDTITGQSSGATGEVTGIAVTSGAWSGTAAGFMYIKSKTGTFQDGENLQVAAATKAVSATGGDAQKKLVFMEPLSEPITISQLGQTFDYTPLFTMGTA
jgi:hypothetical protein